MRRNNIVLVLLLLTLLALLCSCANSPEEDNLQAWLESAQLDAQETPDELYAKALQEEILTIYTISTRITSTKTSFEKQYPGLRVQVVDVRSTEMIEMLINNYERGDYACDVVICNDNNGEFFEKILQQQIAFPYFPYDIVPMLKENHTENELVFLDELQMFYYNSKVFAQCPIENIWQLCEPQYQGKIYMPSPLRSFSTYGFCAMSLTQSEALAQAYYDYCGNALVIPADKTAAEIFWEALAPNIHFTNSSDEVAEAVGNTDDTAFFGLMISSKERLKTVGYHMEPIYRLAPFAASSASTSITIAAGAQNINTAKLFVRWLLGETDGTGEGYTPYQTPGTWSPRTDVPDGSDVPLEDVDLIWLDKRYMQQNRSSINEFLSEILLINSEEN